MRNDAVLRFAPILAVETPSLDAQRVRELRLGHRADQDVRRVVILCAEPPLDATCAIKAITIVGILKIVLWATNTVKVAEGSEINWVSEFVTVGGLVCAYAGARAWERWREG